MCQVVVVPVWPCASISMVYLWSPSQAPHYYLHCPIQSFLDKNKDGGMHHICIEVDNIHEAMKSCKDNKIRCLNKEPKIGAHGKPVVFLHPKDCGGTLVELEEA